MSRKQYLALDKDIYHVSTYQQNEMDSTIKMKRWNSPLDKIKSCKRRNESNRDIASLHAPLPSLDSRSCISMDNLQKSFQGKQFVGSCDGINLHQEN
jgi:hypothetical protein